VFSIKGVVGGDETCEGPLELLVDQLPVADKVDYGDLAIVFDLLAPSFANIFCSDAHWED